MGKQDSAEETFQLPAQVVDALDIHAGVEQLSRSEAICAIVADYLVMKGYLKREPLPPCKPSAPGAVRKR